MADKIRLLPEVVANQIAAGEVVNRPSSVVKEMMENAIDAGAASVKVNFRDGGRELIQIVDDGCGMSPIDARMAFDRHATSKIRDVEDIYALHTFGFRGEALASIAAVAQVELRTRQADDEMGTQTEINGGQFAGQRPVMCPVGSQFFIPCTCHGCIKIITSIAKSIIDRACFKCFFLTPDNIFQGLQPDVIHVVCIMCHHPVKKHIYLLDTFFFFSLCQITENIFFHLYRKFLIIHTILGKIFDMYHTALASIQCTQCLTIRALHLLHFPYSSDSDTKFRFDTIF